MTKRIKKLDSNPTQNRYKIALCVFCFLAVAAWVVWFAIDCNFINKGIDITKTLEEYITSGELKVMWDDKWYNIMKVSAIVSLSTFMLVLFLDVAYLVMKLRVMKQDLKKNIYESLIHTAIIVGTLVCAIYATKMMVDDKYVLEFSQSGEFNLYHLDYLKFMCVPAALIIFGSVAILTSFRPYGIQSMIKDMNVAIIVFAFMSLALFPACAWKTSVSGDVIDFSKYLDPTGELPEIGLVGDFEHLWGHVVAQCITMPIGVFTGTLMVLMFLRIIVTTFLSKDQIIKSHLIVYVIILVLVFGVFIASHVNKLDMAKVLDNTVKTPTLILVGLEVGTGLGAGVYASLSLARQTKKGAK